MKSIPLLLAGAALALAQTAVISDRPPIVAANGKVVSPQQPSAFDCAADGTVVNSVSGEPIARAHVNITSGGITYSTSSDGSGRWVLANLGCVPAQLVVTRPGFLQNTPRLPRTIVLTSGSPVQALKVELVPQSVAWGKVLDDQGDPVMGVQVTAYSANVIDGKVRFQPSNTNATNDLGEYRISSLPRGKYILCTRIVGSMQTNAPTILSDSCYPGPLEGGAASAVDMPAGRESRVDFNLRTVVPVHIRGTVTGQPEGRAIGVNLVRRGLNSDPGGNFPGSGRNGQFDFRVPPGAYMLTADYFEQGKRLSARVPVDAGASDLDSVVVHLDSGFAVTGVVQVISQSGRTPSGYTLSLRPAEPQNGTGQLKWSSDHMSFSITDMLPGSFRLDVFPPSAFYVKSATLAGQDILNSDVQISQAAGPIEVVLRDDGGAIEGDVADADGKPVAAGILLLRNSVRVARQMSQPNGHFKFDNVAPGDYTVHAWDDPTNVEYANPDWMRRYSSGGTSVSVTATQSSPVKLTQQLFPMQ